MTYNKEKKKSIKTNRIRNDEDDKTRKTTLKQLQQNIYIQESRGEPGGNKRNMKKMKTKFSNISLAGKKAVYKQTKSPKREAVSVLW